MPNNRYVTLIKDPRVKDISKKEAVNHPKRGRAVIISFYHQTKVTIFIEGHHLLMVTLERAFAISNVPTVSMFEAMTGTPL